MKVLFVNNGHFDVTLPLINELSSELDCTLNVQIEQNVLRESILDFSFKGDITGMPVEDRETEEVRKRLRGFLRDGIQIVFTKYRSRSFKDPLNWLVTYRWLCWIRERRFDLIHYNGTSMLFFQQILLDRNSPKVFTIHDHVSHLGEESPQVRWLYKYMSYGAKHHFIGQSDFVSRGFASLYGIDLQRIQTIRFGPLGLCKESNDVSVPEEPGTVLFFGRISRYKGLEYLFEAWKIIGERTPEARLIIAGSGDFRFDTKELKTDHRVELHNHYVPNVELARLIRRSSVVVLPYLEATQSGVLMTAYAFGKPVVVTNVGALPEVVEDGGTGYIVPPRDPERLAESIISLLKDDMKREQFSRRIQAKTESEISWPLIAKQTFKVYGRALERRFER